MESSKMDMKSLMNYNKLVYSLPSNLNVVERRQNKVSFADQNAYSDATGNEVVIRLTASTDYVYGPNCYLTFDVQNNGADVADPIGFVKDNAMALFSRVLYEDRSGAELERNDNLNSYCAQVNPWHYSAHSKGVTRAMGGQLESGDVADSTASPPTYDTNGSDANYSTTASNLTVCIPLRSFLGVFNNETLIPSMLCSGSLIRLQLAPAGQALTRFSGTAAVAGTYTITNPRVILDSMSLAPTVQKNLMEQSQSSGGLDFTYETVYYQSGNPQTSSNFNLQINKAVSRCQKMYWSAHAQATPQDLAHSNNGSGQLNIAQLDYRLGDLYFPQRVISVTDDNAQKNGAELYENSLQSVNRMKTDYDPPSISKNEFCNSGEPLDATPANNDNSGRAVHVQSFEQSSALEFSGLAINNSRTLEARINFIGVPAASQVIDAWIAYVKLAKCNQLRAIIKE